MILIETILGNLEQADWKERLRGAEIKIIAVSFNTLALTLMAQPDIRSVADLKGKRLGISRFGSNTDFGTRYLLRKYSIAERDVAFLQFGEAQGIFGALLSGAIHAGVLSYPTTAAAIRRRCHWIAERPSLSRASCSE